MWVIPVRGIRKILGRNNRCRNVVDAIHIHHQQFQRISRIPHVLQRQIPINQAMVVQRVQEVADEAQQLDPLPRRHLPHRIERPARRGRQRELQGRLLRIRPIGSVDLRTESVGHAGHDIPLHHRSRPQHVHRPEGRHPPDRQNGCQSLARPDQFGKTLPSPDDRLVVVLVDKTLMAGQLIDGALTAAAAEHLADLQLAGQSHPARQGWWPSGHSRAFRRSRRSQFSGGFAGAGSAGRTPPPRPPAPSLATGSATARHRLTPGWVGTLDAVRCGQTYAGSGAGRGTVLTCCTARPCRACRHSVADGRWPAGPPALVSSRSIASAVVAGTPPMACPPSGDGRAFRSLVSTRHTMRANL